jgi:3',5'-cyclic AMP phosphodiesterase CpdA
MSSIKVLHLSDIHFREENFWSPVEQQGIEFFGRYGHDPVRLIELDKKIKELDWDILIISGDLTRVGHTRSFDYVKRWLYSTISIPTRKGEYIGLDLGNPEFKNAKHCFIVPGNHDRFNKNGYSFDPRSWKSLAQTKLDNYHEFFQDIGECTKKEIEVNNIKVNIYLCDSTYEHGRFAKGYIDPTALAGLKTTDSELDLVVLHHHLLSYFDEKNDDDMNLINADQVLALLLSKNINGIFYGHTHRSFFEEMSADLIKKELESMSGMRKELHKFERTVRHSIPQKYSKTANVYTVHKRKTINGRYPTLNKYFEYLYIKDVLKKSHILGPEMFEEPKFFYDHVLSYESNFNEEINELFKRKVAISMAPSPTSPTEDETGFHIVEFNWDEQRFICACQAYIWNGGLFV